MSIQGFKPLDPSIALAALKGTTSNAERFGDRDREVREAILREQCPDCNGGLFPRLPQDPSKVFCAEGVNYAKWCATCSKEVMG